MTRLFNSLYIILFCGVLAAVPLLFALGIGVQSSEAFLAFDQRPRSMLAPPGWDRRTVKNFFASFERFLCDRMPFREELLKTRARIGLRFGRLLNPEVVVLGKEGWLFFGNAVGRGIDQYRGLLPLDANTLAALQRYFAGIQRQLAQAGIPFLVVIAPDKHTIYPEFLPAYLSSKGVSPADQITTGSPGLEILDLRPVLLEAKQHTSLPLYYKTDSHWNEFGAYLAYRNIMERLPLVEPVTAKESDFLQLPGAGKGDLAVKVGGAVSFSDVLTHIRRDFFRGTLAVENLQDASLTRMLAVEINRISAFPSLRVSNPDKTGSILILGDSFLENMTPFFNNTFGSIAYQHYASFGASHLSRLVARFHPKAVVYVIVERNLRLPASTFIPASRSTHSEITAGRTSTTAVQTSPVSRSVLIPHDSLLAASSLVRGIENIRQEDGEACFTSTGDDPYFHLPPAPPMPEGAMVAIDITLPAERMVQLFYQTIDKPEFTEHNSITKVLPAGHHLVEWDINAPLNGAFRLDPGNGPGEYRIRKVELLSSSPADAPEVNPAFAFANDRLLAESSLVHGIENIRTKEDGVCFTSTGNDPYFHLPPAPPMPEGATVAIELTLPAERMVQFFYQTTARPVITEENSFAKGLPAGRHVIEWQIKAPLNGVFRLDPGNGPGEYRIHRVELRP